MKNNEMQVKTETSQKGFRDDYFDIVRGVAVFLMLWGHSIQYTSCGAFDFFENKVFQFIYSFHMPLFMLLAGYFFYFSTKKRSIRSVLLKRIKSLGIPLIIWGFFSLLFNHYRYNSPIHLNSLIDSCNGYWFVWVTIVATVLTGLIEWFISYIPNKTIASFASIIHIAVFLLIFLVPHNIPMLRYHLFQYMYPYFILGFLFNKFKDLIPYKTLYLRYLCVFLFPIMFSHFQRNTFIYLSGINIHTEFGINTHQLNVDLFRWSIGLIGSIGLMVVIELLIRLPYVQFVLKILFGKIGTMSLQIYVTQRLLLETVYAIQLKQFVQLHEFTLFTQNIPLFNFYWTPLIAVLFALTIYCFVKIIQKISLLNLILYGGR